MEAIRTMEDPINANEMRQSIQSIRRMSSSILNSHKKGSFSTEYLEIIQKRMKE